jgi:CO/xanthine dehydrogenase FAD-binding subunit
MLDRELSDQLVEEIARRIAASLSPLDDHRASADYRLTLCGNLWRRYVDDLRSAEVSV